MWLLTLIKEKKVVLRMLLFTKSFAGQIWKIKRLLSLENEIHVTTFVNYSAMKNFNIGGAKKE